MSTTNKLRWIEKLSSIYQAYKNFLNGLSSCQEAIETNSQKLRWIEIAITVVKKRRSRGSIDSLAVERYREVVKRYRDAVKMCKNSFSKKRKTQK